MKDPLWKNILKQPILSGSFIVIRFFWFYQKNIRNSKQHIYAHVWHWSIAIIIITRTQNVCTCFQERNLHGKIVLSRPLLLTHGNSTKGTIWYKLNDAVFSTHSPSTYNSPNLWKSNFDWKTTTGSGVLLSHFINNFSMSSKFLH